MLPKKMYVNNLIIIDRIQLIIMIYLPIFYTNSDGFIGFFFCYKNIVYKRKYSSNHLSAWHKLNATKKQFSIKVKSATRKPIQFILITFRH